MFMTHQFKILSLLKCCELNCDFKIKITNLIATGNQKNCEFSRYLAKISQPSVLRDAKGTQAEYQSMQRFYVRPCTQRTSIDLALSPSADTVSE